MPVRVLDGRRYVQVQVGTSESRLIGVSEWVEGLVLSDLVDEASGERLAGYFDHLGRIAARIDARPELGRRDAFERVLGMARRQAATLPGWWNGALTA